MLKNKLSPLKGNTKVSFNNDFYSTKIIFGVTNPGKDYYYFSALPKDSIYFIPEKMKENDFQANDKPSLFKITQFEGQPRWVMPKDFLDLNKKAFSFLKIQDCDNQMITQISPQEKAALENLKKAEKPIILLDNNGELIVFNKQK